jgi:phosphoribosylanthranilate isomerase
MALLFRSFLILQKIESMLNKRILVKSITSLSEARYCAGMFVDFISFDLNEDSPYYIPKKSYEEIRGWLSGVKILGSITGLDLEKINAIVDEYGLDGLILSKEQQALLPFLSVDIVVQEWNTLPLPPLNSDSILLWTAQENPPEMNGNEILVGFDFQHVKRELPHINGYAFMGSFERQVGDNSYEELMQALEYIEENY